METAMTDGMKRPGCNCEIARLSIERRVLEVLYIFRIPSPSDELRQLGRGMDLPSEAVDQLVSELVAEVGHLAEALHSGMAGFEAVIAELHGIWRRRSNPTGY